MDNQNFKKNKTKKLFEISELEQKIHSSIMSEREILEKKRREINIELQSNQLRLARWWESLRTRYEIPSKELYYSDGKIYENYNNFCDE